MQLVLEKRAERSKAIALISPLIAIGLTIVTMSILFAILGKNPVSALGVYFIDPLTDSYSLQELVVKATPLVMIAIGLSLCYLANAWNIGAEGQFLIGAVAGSWLAVKTQGTGAGHWVLPAMLLLGTVAGALYALIPAICKVRFGASEILTSLMLVYVADLFLDYLVRGPWRDPAGFNFPTTAEFDPVATVPVLIEGGRLHLGAIIALLVVAAATVLLGRTIKGFEIRVAGAAPRAAGFGGFNSNQLILLTFAVSGALAGLAGIIEVAGPVGHLQPGISPGYGFTAIIVAFLGRLNPIGILIAGLFLALTFIGGEQAQIAMKIPLDVTKVFQGILLFYVLACDSLILYRFRLIFASRQVASGLALTILGIGLSGLIGAGFVGERITPAPHLHIPGLTDIPLIGRILFGEDPFIYLSLALVVAVWGFLYRTRPGLVLRACGDNHVSAHALGYPVLRIRTLAVMFGGACAGLAGAYLPLAYTPFFIPGMTAGRGWIALALVVFASWRPGRLVVGAYLFGAVSILQLHAQGWGVGIPSQFMSALPYLATVIVLVLISRARTGGSTAPAALGTVFVPDR